MASFEANKKNRFSLVGAKKKVASKVSDTKVGRSTLVKALGEQSDEIVSSVKEVVSKYENREIAKKLKKNTVKWILKISVLWKDKQLTGDMVSHLQRPAQMFAERFLFTVDNYPRGARDVTRLREEGEMLTELISDLVEPLCREKNHDKLKSVANYYCDTKFLTALLNEEKYEEELSCIYKNVKELLLPFPSVFDDDKSSLDALERAEYCHQIIEAEFSLVLGDFPQITNMFLQFVSDNNDGVLVRKYEFLLAMIHYQELSSKQLRRSRAEMLVSKYLTESGPKHIDIAANCLVDITNKLKEAHTDLFSEVQHIIESELRETFNSGFVSTSTFAQYQQERREEFEELRKRFGDQWTEQMKIRNRMSKK